MPLMVTIQSYFLKRKKEKIWTRVHQNETKRSPFGDRLIRYAMAPFLVSFFKPLSEYPTWIQTMIWIADQKSDGKCLVL